MRNDANLLDRMIAGEQVNASAEVRELAQLAALLQGAWQAEPTAAATGRTRSAALSAFVASGNGNGNGAVAKTAAVATVRASRARRLVARVALAAALVVALPAAALAASGDALPGQPMHAVKRGFEEIRLVLAGDPIDEARVLLDIAGERVGEAVVARGLDLPSAATAARAGYEEAVARFEARIAEAEALGLPTDDVLNDAAGLFEKFEQVLGAIFGTPAPEEPASEPTEVLSSAVPPETGGEGDQEEPQASEKKTGDRDRKGDRKGDRRTESGGAAGGGGGSESADADGGGGGGGGQSTGGGGGNGGGGADAKEHEPPAVDQTDDDDGDDDDGDDDGDDQGDDAEDDDDDDHEGRGLGHDKAIGEGHHKDSGEGHSED